MGFGTGDVGAGFLTTSVVLFAARSDRVEGPADGVGPLASPPDLRPEDFLLDVIVEFG